MADGTAELMPYRYTRVGKHVLELIEAGALKPGDRIPSLRSMSTKMRVSISTVSQAYVELESQGVVEARPKSGFFVRSQFRRLPPLPACEGRSVTEPCDVNRGELISTVKDLIGRHDFLPFTVASPDVSLLPAKELARIMAAVVREDPARLIGYEPISGNPELRRQIAFRCIDAGVTVLPDEIIVTAGAMEAISIAVRCLTRPGDVVLIQSPAYYCFLQLIDTLGLRVIELPSDPVTGISPRDLAEAINQYEAKACVLNSNFNNPDGSVIPDAAKEEIVRLLARKAIPLIEDDICGDLHFGPNRPQVCKKYDRNGMVMLCSSFSKTIAPGYRVGWLIPGKFHEKAKILKGDTSVCTASPSQVVIAEFLRAGRHERHLKRLRNAIARHMQTLQLAVVRYFPPETRITRPTGGGLLWLELPKGADSRDFFFQAYAQGIGVVPGLICSTSDRFRNFIRLSCSGVWNKETEKGIETLGQLAAHLAR